MSQSSTKDFPRKQQIEIFFNSHKSKSQLHDVSVTEMRHMIPLIFMEVYAEKCGQYTKKVKGLWEKRPPDWPANVPFVDPNNKLKNEGGVGCKPKKELLGQMLNYLIKRYEKAQNGGPTFDLGAVFPLLSDPGPQMFDLIESDDPLLGQSIGNSVDHNQFIQEFFDSASDSYYSQGMPPSVPVDLNYFESIDEFENPKLFEGIQDQEELIKPPEQAMDNDDCNLGDVWNPSAQLQRIQQKLNYLEKQKLVKDTKLESMAARLKKLKEVDYASADLSSLIDDLHALEKEIDIIKFSKRMPTKRISEISSDKSTTDLMKPASLENETTSYSIYMVADDHCNEVPIGVEDPELMSSLNIEPRSGGGPQESGPVNNLSLRFVSGLAPEVLNPSPPNVSVMSDNHHGGSQQPECVSFRYVSQPLSETQNVGFPMSTMLSENCKPIQAAEDDIQQFHNPLQDLEELLHFQQNPSFTLDEDLSFLNISNGNGPSTRTTLAPVEEINNTINLAYLDAGQVNAVSGNAGAVPQLILPGNNGLGGQISSAASIAPAEATKNVTIPAEVFRYLLQHVSRAIAQPAPVVSEQKSFSAGFQPPAANNRRDGKPGGKRSRLLLDEEEEMEVAVSNLQPSPEISCNTLIPTMVEEMGDSDSMLRFPKKSKKMF